MDPIFQELAEEKMGEGGQPTRSKLIHAQGQVLLKGWVWGVAEDLVGSQQRERGTHSPFTMPAEYLASLNGIVSMRGDLNWTSGSEEKGYRMKVYILNGTTQASPLGFHSAGVRTDNLSTPGHWNILICENWQPHFCLSPAPARILA